MQSRPRSPNYPSVSLAEAVEKAKALYGKEGRSPFNPEAAAHALGYKSFSGPVRSIFAALRQYGLIEGKKGAEARLSNRALTLALRTESAREYREALREAALEPELFQEISEERPSASDESLRHYLIVERNFTDDGARRAIQAFRDNMALVGVEQPDKMPGLDQEDRKDEMEMPSTRTPPPLATLPSVFRSDSTVYNRVPLQLRGGKYTVTLELPQNIDSGAWEQMVAMLAALKPGYVVDDAPKPDNQPQVLEATERPSEEAATNGPEAQ